MDRDNRLCSISDAIKDRLVDSIEDWHNTPAGIHDPGIVRRLACIDLNQYIHNHLFGVVASPGLCEGLVNSFLDLLDRLLEDPRLLQHKPIEIQFAIGDIEIAADDASDPPAFGEPEEADLPAPDPELVNHPDHYNQGDIECIEAIRAMLTEEEFRGYLKGTALPYIWRERHKGGDVDIKKAIWNLQYLIQ